MYYSWGYQLFLNPPSLRMAAMAALWAICMLGYCRFLDDPKTQCLPPFFRASGFLAHHEFPQQTTIEVGPWNLIVSGIKMQGLLILLHVCVHHRPILQILSQFCHVFSLLPGFNKVFLTCVHIESKI